MAGALRVQLGGGATYDGVPHERPILGNGRSPDSCDLGRAMRIYLTSCALLWALALAVGVLFWPR
jgi:adenosylcobinamide-phosphate synthase